MLCVALVDCSINENCYVVDWGWSILPAFFIPIADIWHPPLGICYPRQKIVNAQGLPLGGGGCIGTAEIDWCITSKLPNKTVKSCPLLASFCRMKSLIKLNLQCWHPYLFCGFSGKFSKEAKNRKFQTKGEEETRSRAICTRKELCGGREKDSTPRVFSWVNCTVYPGIKLQTPGLVKKRSKLKVWDNEKNQDCNDYGYQPMASLTIEK